MPGKKTNQAISHLEKKFHERYNFYIPSHLKDFLTGADLKNFLQDRFIFFRKRSSPISVRIHNRTNQARWPFHGTVIEIVMIDMPFIVDTILDYLNAEEISINSTLQPVFAVKRNVHGALEDLKFTDESDAGNYDLESFVYIEIPEQPEDVLQKMEREIASNLQDLQVVVSDFPLMLEHLYSMNFQDDHLTHDTAWLKRNFVFLGMIAVHRDHYSHYGIFKNGDRKKEGEAFLKKTSLDQHETITFHETNLTSKVDRKREIYFILFHSGGQTLLLAGHFTRRANLTPRSDIPFVRRKIDRVASGMKIHFTSHMYKELLNASIIFPVGTLGTRSDDLIREWMKKILHSLYTEEPTTGTFLDVKHNRLWILSIVPLQDSEQVDTSELRKFESSGELIIRKNVRQRYDANEIFLLGLEPLRTSLLDLDHKLSDSIEYVFSSWKTRFRRAAENRLSGGGRSIDAKVHQYLSGLSPDYEIHQTPEEAFDDLFALENMDQGDPAIVRIYNRTESEDYIKIYSTEKHYLSDLIPTLNQFSFQIQGEYTFPFQSDQGLRTTYAFSIPTLSTTQTDRNRIALAIAHAINGKTTREPMNALTVSAGLTVADLNIVKALTGYYFQIDKSHSRFFLGDILLAYPVFTRSLVEFFHSRLDPDWNSQDSAEEKLEDSFLSLKSALEESICRKYTSVVKAIVRTGAFLHPEEVSFKIRSKEIEGIPWPIPLFEIYIYSSIYEGIHLRSGYVARGGIRWSDRPDDFRTEIHGLMKAQMVKNTIIVPAGSKGGFAIKARHLPKNSNPKTMGKEIYQRFITALLELTDNLSSDRKIIPPKNIIRRDQNDAYLVVAADKGTATFSDAANQISDDMNFWLSDAFASGGKFGYDHKKQGITAKGAWESVKHLFQEMGIHPEKDPITVAGIGDMGGDVFGNGMLLSKSMKLVAAFNHLYIFLDPNPDPASSFQERKRLFQKSLNWDSYKRELISSGGGIFDRNSRKITLSREAQRALKISESSLSGEALIQKILQAPVDLLWNGGIGTYVKGSTEAHYEAGDPSNDRVRIDGKDLQCKIVGEGGNLGLTQLARIEAAKKGVRLNTDAIDNSGGVDMSDHEVNLKILLGGLLKKGKLKSLEERNSLIRTYEKRMIEKVLWHNQFNNLALSLDEIRSKNQLSYYRSLIRRLVREKVVDRQLDRLPLESELDFLEQEHSGLSRPTLSSLMGFTKLFIKEQILESSLFDDPWFDRFVFKYFPEDIEKKYREDAIAHPLKKEIITTEVVNRAINPAGIDFFERMTLRTQKPEAEILNATIRLSEFMDISKIRRETSPAAGEDPTTYFSFLIFLQDRVRRILETLLESPEKFKAIDDQNQKTFESIVSESIQFSGKDVMPQEVEASQSGKASRSKNQLEKAYKVADVIEDAFDIFTARILDKKKWDVADYFRVLNDFRIREIRPMAEGISPASSWEEPFLIRIEHSLKELASLAMDIRTNSQERYKNHTIKSSEKMNELFRLRDSQKLSPAAFYEILGRIKEEITRES